MSNFHANIIKCLYKNCQIFLQRSSTLLIKIVNLSYKNRQSFCSYHERRVHQLAYLASCGMPHLVLQFNVETAASSLSTAAIACGLLYHIRDTSVRYGLRCPLSHPALIRPCRPY